jgi:hypothetical protein
MAKSITDNVRTMAVVDIKKIIVVGCGGTGSILAEHICRLLKGNHLDNDIAVILYDGDIIEDSNITRQNFQPHEIGSNKASALGLRLSGQFEIPVAACSYNLTTDIVDSLTDDVLLISCTDTLQSRRICAGSGGRRRMWLDIGNGLHHGQAVFGTTHCKKDLADMSDRFDYLPYARDTPDIAAMNPRILKARTAPVKPSCAALPFMTQGFGVNALAALAGAVLVKQAVVDKKVTVAAIYFNVSEARMSPRDITRSLYAQWSK